MAKSNKEGDYMKGTTSFMYFMVLRKPSHCIWRNYYHLINQPFNHWINQLTTLAPEIKYSNYIYILCMMMEDGRQIILHEAISYKMLWSVT